MKEHLLIPHDISPTSAKVWLGWGRQDPPEPTEVVLKRRSGTSKTVGVGPEIGEDGWSELEAAFSDDRRALVRLVEFDDLAPGSDYTVEWVTTDGAVLATETFATARLDLPSSWPVVPVMNLPRFRDMWLSG